MPGESFSLFNQQGEEQKNKTEVFLIDGLQELVDCFCEKNLN